MAERAFLVCATPRSGSTLVCQALRKTGVAGVPDEYFEALLHSGRPRRPEEYFVGVGDESIFDHLGERGVGDEHPRGRRSGAGPPTTAIWNGRSRPARRPTVCSRRSSCGLLRLRNVPRYRDLPPAELLPAVFPDLTYVRVVRANKIRQAVSLWKAVQTATWREVDLRHELPLDEIGEGL